MNIFKLFPFIDEIYILNYQSIHFYIQKGYHLNTNTCTCIGVV